MPGKKRSSKKSNEKDAAPASSAAPLDGATIDPVDDSASAEKAPKAKDKTKSKSKSKKKKW